MNRAELATEDSQKDDEGQLLKVVVKEEEETTKDEQQLKEEEDLMQFLIVELAKVKCEESEADNSKFVEEQPRKTHQSILHIFEQKYEVEWRGHSNVS